MRSISPKIHPKFPPTHLDVLLCPESAEEGLGLLLPGDERRAPERKKRAPKKVG